MQSDAEVFPYIVKTLGLRGKGCGQSVGLRSKAVLLDTGKFLTVSSAKLLKLEPPRADILVEAVLSDPLTGTHIPVWKHIRVDVDDLAPLGATEMTVVPGRIYGYEPRIPDGCGFEEIATPAMSDDDRAPSMAGICKTLGLRGDGIGQSVGLRSYRLILDSGMALTVTCAKIANLNPTYTYADIYVEGVTSALKDGTQQPVTKRITVDVDDLAPLDTEEITDPPHLEYVVFGYEKKWLPKPLHDCEEHVISAMKSAIQATMAQFSLYSVRMVKNQVKVNYYYPNGVPEEGKGYLVCRAKVHIPRGMLHLYPYGGTVLHIKDYTERSEIEQRLNLKPCYMRGVRASAKMSETNLSYSASTVKGFIMYSPLPPVFTVGDDDKVKVGNVPPFWAVQPIRRSYAPFNQMINMIPQVEEYSLGSPAASHLGLVKVGISVQMPFLTNTKALTPDDQLLVPLSEDICWRTFPPMPLQCNQSAEAISHSSDPEILPNDSE